ncbi:MAG: 1-deoxy-D-xylulose-5-phosphate reductoisomerase [Firmicutes bacterium]|nr:1-deoxy-D-xylulose-5-phosphate reductoisomerase [Bacillota bacterium]MDH7494943.1 1-deoxy-D-xylulose-5-phosphate reductoisomerase [Bacillota bacterium]
MRRGIAVLGSTGSIGTQALEVAGWLGDSVRVVGLAAGRNIDVLEAQIRRWAPSIVGVADEVAARELRGRISDLQPRVEVVSGSSAAERVAAHPDADVVLSAAVGIAGFLPTYAAICLGKTVALANKETLVAAGRLVMEEASRRGATVIPVDSEHSALFQCLAGRDKSEVKRLVLTASGGPLRTLDASDLEKVRPEQALRHPTWCMGAKITIDSATLMNKALEVIEARWLFDVDPDRIDVVVHPQSVIHSMVELVDGSIIAQLGPTDMRIPIQYALTYPSRVAAPVKALDVSRLGALTFEPPDLVRFPALRLGYEALRAGGTTPCVLSAANEEAVKMFLEGRIRLPDIAALTEDAMASHDPVDPLTPSDVLEADGWAREHVARRAADIEMRRTR